MPADAKIDIDANLLRRLHHGHQLVHDLQSQVDRAPFQLKASEARVAKLVVSVEEVKEKRKQIKISSDQKQLQLAEREGHIKILETKLNTAASNREFSTLQDEIAADRKANEVLSDEILESLEQIDQVNADLTKAEDAHAAELADHQQRCKAIEDRLAVATEDLQLAQSSLESAEAKIPSAMKSDYDRIVQSKGEEGLAPLEDESCGGCNQTLTTQVIDRLRLSKLVRCPNCDAFLYMTS